MHTEHLHWRVLSHDEVQHTFPHGASLSPCSKWDSPTRAKCFPFRHQCYSSQDLFVVKEEK